MLIEINQVPPTECSPNWWGHRGEKYRAAQVYRKVVFYSCAGVRNKAEKDGKKLPLRRARLDSTFVFRDRRRRDADNVLARFKPGLDAIKDAGLIRDDDSEYLEVGEVEILVNPELAPLTVIALTEARG